MKKSGRGAHAPSAGSSTARRPTGTKGPRESSAEAKVSERGAGAATSDGPHETAPGAGATTLTNPHKGKNGLRRRRRRRGKARPADAVTVVAGDVRTEAAPAERPTAGVRKGRRRRRRGRDTGQPGAIPLAKGRPEHGALPQAEIAAGSAMLADTPSPRSIPSPNVPAPPAAGFAPRPVYAALDLGTNNCRLLLAAPSKPGQFRVVDAFSRIVRLGEGLGASGRLRQEAMDRAIDALAVCRDKLKARPVRKFRLIATEACRSAANGPAFLERVAEETGLELEIIDRETEARLAVSGCGSLVERDTRAVVLFDIGGGSSEIALIDLSGRRSGRLADHIVAWTSLPVGVVTLAEAFGGHHVTPESFEGMVAHVAGHLDRFENRHSLGALARSDAFHLLGTSGTVTTIAGLHLGLERYDRRRVDGLWMHRDDVDAMLDRLMSWSFEERRANPCIGADRADLVLAGCAIFEAIRRVWPARRLRVADRGLREGLLMEMMAADGAWQRDPAPGARS